MTELEKELKNRAGEQRENGSTAKDKRRAERDTGRPERASGSNETEKEKKTEREVSQNIGEGDEREIGKGTTEKEGNDNRRQYRETEQKERDREEEREEANENDSSGKESVSTSHGVTEMPKNTEVNSQEFIQLKELMFYQLSPSRLVH